MYDDESDSDKPDENQIELVKKLHREMADRQIIVNMKNKIKNKKECVNFDQNRSILGQKLLKNQKRSQISVNVGVEMVTLRDKILI